MKFKLIILSVLLAVGFASFSKQMPSGKSQEQTALKEQRTQEIRDSLNRILAAAKDGEASAMNEMGTWYYNGKHVEKDYREAVGWWEKSVSKNNIRAIANLGLCYQLGNGVRKDSLQAVNLYEKAIQGGNSALLKQREGNAGKSPFDAMLVGECYEKGLGVKKNYAQAAQYYSLAAEKGSVAGMRQAGLCYLNAKENPVALKYFEEGASLGDLSCEYWAGKMLVEGMNVPVNKQQGVVYLLKAAEGGFPAAQAEMGELYAEGNGVTKNLSQSADWFRKSAVQGNAKGMWNYGMMLKDGIGVRRDYDQALFWMSEAAQQGYQRAFKNMVAKMDSVGNEPYLNYIKGMKLYLVDGKLKEASGQFKKVEKAKIDEGKIMQAVILASRRNEKPNVKKALKELEKLASDNPEAAFYVATLYETGNGTAPDMQKAIEYYRKAADKGFGKAQSYLADIYYEGRGTEKDLITAIALYNAALENRQLSRDGYTRLAECYENGSGGLQKDEKKAAGLRSVKYRDNVIATLKTPDL